MLVATYNIQWGKGRDGRVDLDRVARTIASADLIGLQEVERNWREMEHADQVRRFMELCPDRYVYFAQSVDVDNSRKGADGRVDNRRREYGLLVISRWPILVTRSFPLPKYPVHGHLNDTSILLETVIGHPNRPFRFYVTHLNYLSERQRIIQTRLVVDIISDAVRQGGPVTGPGVPAAEFGSDWIALEKDEVPSMPSPAILLGDFNMMPLSPEYDILTGPVSPDYGRLAEYGLFVDALKLAGLKDTEGVTYPANDIEQAKRIDHIFLTSELAGLVRRAWIDNDADASDHQPVYAEIEW
ncbi:MAG: hydrolase [Alphaproteobacteria bacterium]|nr:hydrolase [Alphaproteobacteria bacterium]